MKEEGPAPKLTEAREEAAMMAAEQMVPAEETVELAAPERFESLGEVASNAVLGEAGTSGHIAVGSMGDLGAGPSGPPDGGASWAVVQ